MKNILIVVVVIAAFCIGFVYSNAMSVCPKDLMTANHLAVIERATRQFLKDKHRMPSSIDELIEAKYTEDGMDGWGNRIEYTIIDGNTVKLVSSGDPRMTAHFNIEYRIKKIFSVQSKWNSDSDDSANQRNGANDDVNNEEKHP